MSYYDRQGQPIGLEEWAVLFENFDYKSIERTDVDEYRVSTVWLGLDHRLLDDGPPLIFETMVFQGHMADLLCWRYPTEEAARAGHAQVVAGLRDGTLELEGGE